jgi:hypothetical protein
MIREDIDVYQLCYVNRHRETRELYYLTSKQNTSNWLQLYTECPRDIFEDNVILKYVL